MVRVLCGRRGRVCRAMLLVCGGVFLVQIYHALTISALVTEQQERLQRQQDDPPPNQSAGNASVIRRSPPALIPSEPAVAPPGESAASRMVSPCGGSMMRPSASLSQRADNWIKLAPHDVYAYSSYADARSSRAFVRILAVSASKGVGSFYCHLWYAGRNSPVMVKAQWVPISERGPYSHYAGWLACSMSAGADPEAVSLASSSCGATLADLPVHSLSGRKQEHTFMVCICGPVKFNYSDASQLMEWIEVNSVFGAEKFVAYNHSANSVLLPYTHHYTTTGRLDWLPWDLPLTKSNIKNFGHMALLNDCLYRTMYRTKYVAFLDLDEFIVPKQQHKSWLSVLEANNCQEKASANFRNVFYKLEWPDDPKTAANSSITALKLKTLLKTKREKKVWAHRSRSKYFARPEMLLEAGVHSPHRYIDKSSYCDVNESQAWVQHYRWWDDPKPDWVEDRTLLRFADDIVGRISSAHASAQGAEQHRMV